MIEILCGVLNGPPLDFDRAPSTGAARGTDDSLSNSGHFFIAFEIGMFRNPLEFVAIMDGMLGESAAGMADANPFLNCSGLHAWRLAQERRASGIPIGRSLLDRLDRLARRCGIEPLCLTRC